MNVVRLILRLIYRGIWDILSVGYAVRELRRNELPHLRKAINCLETKVDEQTGRLNALAEQVGELREEVVKVQVATTDVLARHDQRIKQVEDRQ